MKEKNDDFPIVESDKSICTMSFKEAMEDDGMSEKIEKYYDKWEKLKFTENFPKERKKELAYAFEQLAVFLLYYAKEDGDKLFSDRNNFFEIGGFALMRRVLENLEPNEFDFQKFLEYSKTFNLIDVVRMFEGRMFLGIEAEAEACKTVSDMIVTKFKNQNADNEDIRKILYNALEITTLKKYE